MCQFNDRFNNISIDIFVFNSFLVHFILLENKNLFSAIYLACVCFFEFYVLVML